MKITNWTVALLAAGGMVLAGCNKTPPPPKGYNINGVLVEVPRLQKAFMQASPELQQNVTKVSFGLRYGQYMTSLAALDALANNASTTPEQKKVVNDVIEQMKQVIQKSTAPPGQ